MRLESITVRNYRTHRECSVELDRERTLIGGRNESGKSTLIEAAHRALFVRATTGGEVRKSMVSHTHAGHPEVEVAFEARGRRWRIVKRFSGANGTATLTEIGGSSWSGDAAEQKLGELLGSEVLGGAAARKAPEQWAHVWVWQGCSGEDPTAHATTHCDDLVARLQREGGAAAVQSACDQRVAGQIAERLARLYTESGQPRTNSPLAEAQKEEAAAHSALTAAQQMCDRLERAVADFSAAEKQLTDARAALEQLQPQQRECEEKLRRVAALLADDKAQLATATAAAEKHQALLTQDGLLAKLRGELQQCRMELTPLEAATASLAQGARAMEAADQQAEEAKQRALDGERAARLRRELAGAHLQRIERQKAHEQLAQRAAQVRALQGGLVKLEAVLAEIAGFTPKKLATLQALESSRKQAEAARDAMAAGLEVVASNEPVRIGGSEVPPGGEALLTEATEIQIGPAIRLRIRPGGGDSLAEARERVRSTGENLQRELDKLGVTTLEAAVQSTARCQQAEAELRTLKAQLETLGAATLEKELAAAEGASIAAQAEVARRAEQCPEEAAPADETAARTLQAALAEALQEAERQAVAATSARKAAAESLAAARARLEQHRSGFESRRQHAANLTAQLQMLLETLGEDAPRHARLHELAADRARAESVLAQTRASLTELQPQLLAADQSRLARALAQHAESERLAATKRAVAQSELQRDGSSDPLANLALAAERLHAATERRQRAEREARAVALLHELFVSEQKALADRFTQPLAARISTYLECLFGPGARAEVTFEASEFSGLRLFRPSHGEQALEFDQLSGGAREQLAAAVRLALAEVLADAHDGCLPVVFDDAFAYSDSDRVQVLQRMLDVAAARGLQIIVLTCNPADYAGLGARAVTLRIDPTARRAPVPTPASAAGADRGAAPVESVTPEQKSAFLAALTAAGRRSGNTALLGALGWEKATYESVKATLVEEGAIQPGRGRGGTVTLPGADDDAAD